AAQPKKNGYDATSAMVAYEKKKLGKKGFEKAAAQAREMLADALEDDNVPYGDRLKLAGWLVEHDLKRKKELGDDSQLGPDMATVLRFRLAIMRAVQKGIMLGVAEPDRAVQVSGRLGDKMLELAKLVQEEL
nr:hypothetical protein [Anaerolineae bacterium]